MNPWTQSFEQYRQEILGETKKKYDKQSKERWQDDDCDDKWYEKSDVDGKISDREKKEKKKHYAKEDIADIIARLEKKRISKGGDPDESPLPSMKKYHASKKKKKVKKGDWIGPPPKKESVEVNHIDGSTTQIIDVVRAPAMVAAPKFSNWKEEMSYEALKGEKLDIDAEKGKVKNHVDINPTIKTEEKKNLDEGKVKYYSGQDRNPNTGLPKGLKASPIRTEKEVSKKLDRTTLAQSYEPEGEELVDEGLGKLIDKGITGAFNTADKVSAAMDKNPVGRFVKGAAKKVFGPWKSTDGGTNRLSPTKATHGPTWQNNSYEPEGELVDEKVATGPRLGEPREKGATHPNAGEGEKIQKRTLKWMRARGKPGSPGLKDMKDRYKEHEDSQKKSRAKKKVEEHHKKPGEEHPIDESIFGPELTKYLGKKNIKKNVQVPPEQKDFVKSMPDPTVISGGRTKVQGGPTVSNWRSDTNKALQMLKQSHEPQGEVIQEKPGDGWVGPTINTKGGPIGIPNPIRITKDIVDKTNRNQQKKVDAINKISPGSASMPKVNYFNKGSSAATKRLGLDSYEPEGEVLEATKYSKVKGKNYKSGKKSVKGGTAKGDLAYKTALANIINQVGAGGVQQSSKQGKKKKGEKGRKQIGDRKFSPAETIRRRKASAKAAYKAMTDTRGT